MGKPFRGFDSAGFQVAEIWWFRWATDVDRWLKYQSPDRSGSSCELLSWFWAKTPYVSTQFHTYNHSDIWCIYNYLIYKIHIHIHDHTCTYKYWQSLTLTSSMQLILWHWNASPFSVRYCTARGHFAAWRVSFKTHLSRAKLAEMLFHESQSCPLALYTQKLN